jgi:hypothetical protein
VGNSTNRDQFAIIFGEKPGLARLLNWKGHGSPTRSGGQKGRKKMFRSNVNHHLIALFGAFLMSTVAVSAAAGPIEVPSQSVSVNA